MEIIIPPHARERMEAYNVDERLVVETLDNADREMMGYGSRMIAQKKLNGYVLRVIYEKGTNTKVVITVYKARRERYEI